MKKLNLAEYLKKLSFGGEVKAHDPRRFGLPKAELVKLVQSAQQERKLDTEQIVAAASARGLSVNRRYNDDSCWDWASPFKPNWLLFASSDESALRILKSEPLRFQINVTSREAAGGMDFVEVEFSGPLTQEVYDSLCREVLAKYKVAHISTPAEIKAYFDGVGATKTTFTLVNEQTSLERTVPTFPNLSNDPLRKLER